MLVLDPLFRFMVVVYYPDRLWSEAMSLLATAARDFYCQQVTVFWCNSMGQYRNVER